MSDETTRSVADKVQQEFSQFPLRSYPKGQILVFAKENPDHIFYLVKGQVRQYDVSYRGDEVTINVFKPSAFFPMSWAINNTPNVYFYKTEQPTDVHIVPADKAVAFLKDNPDVLFDLLSRVYRGLDGLLGRMVHLMSGTAKSRLLYELIIECRRFGKANEHSYVLSASEVDLASRSGLSRETVSREMKKLKENGLVQLKPEGILIPDYQALETLLGTTI